MHEIIHRLRGIPFRLLACALLMVVPGAATAEEAWQIGPRTLPPPAGASPELQDYVKTEPQPNPAFRRMMAPSTPEAWKNLVESLDQDRYVPLEVLEEDFGLTIARDTIGEVPVYRITPDEIARAHMGHLFLHVHGGGYLLGGGDNAPAEAAVIAGALKIPAISIDYRMPPDHPFPAAVEDVVAVYRSILEERKSRTIVLGGTSAGGGLSLASVHQFKADGLDLPGAIFAGTPWADLTKTGDTLYTNEGIDHTLVTYDGMLKSMAELYAGGTSLKDPLVSPVYGNFEGFPPTYFITGTRDLFLSDTARTHRKMREAGVIADLNVYEGQSHADYILLQDLPESGEYLRDLGHFLEATLPGTRGISRWLVPPFFRRY